MKKFTKPLVLMGIIMSFTLTSCGITESSNSDGEKIINSYLGAYENPQGIQWNDMENATCSGTELGATLSRKSAQDENGTILKKGWRTKSIIKKETDQEDRVYIKYELMDGNKRGIEAVKANDSWCIQDDELIF